MRGYDLRGKVALVSGASRGVGAAIAVELARAGASVACAARSTAASPQRTPGTLDDTVARILGAGGHAATPTPDAVPTTELIDGLVPDDATVFAEPHAHD